MLSVYSNYNKPLSAKAKPFIPQLPTLKATLNSQHVILTWETTELARDIKYYIIMYENMKRIGDREITIDEKMARSKSLPITDLGKDYNNKEYTFTLGTDDINNNKLNHSNVVKINSSSTGQHNLQYQQQPSLLPHPQPNTKQGLSQRVPLQQLQHQPSTPLQLYQQGQPPLPTTPYQPYQSYQPFQRGGNYEQKYLKYKNKYLQLKKLKKIN